MVAARRFVSRITGADDSLKDFDATPVNKNVKFITNSIGRVRLLKAEIVNMFTCESVARCFGDG